MLLEDTGNFIFLLLTGGDGNWYFEDDLNLNTGFVGPIVDQDEFEGGTLDV
jgi:hypothetical protein